MSDLTVLGLLVIGMAVGLIAVSRYRHWLAFMAAGMGAWCGVEIIRWVIERLSGWTTSQSYVATILLLLALAMAWLIRHDARQRPAVRRLIEHTPVYDEKPLSDLNKYASR